MTQPTVSKHWRKIPFTDVTRYLGVPGTSLISLSFWNSVRLSCAAMLHRRNKYVKLLGWKIWHIGISGAIGLCRPSLCGYYSVVALQTIIASARKGALTKYVNGLGDIWRSNCTGPVSTAIPLQRPTVLSAVLIQTSNHLRCSSNAAPSVIQRNVNCNCNNKMSPIEPNQQSSTL